LGKILWVGLGGFLGSIGRYLLSGYIQNLVRGTGFPYGTLAVNLTGCLFIGFLSQWVETRGFLSPEARLFVFMGLLGGFTTFSTFSNETMNLWQAGDSTAALANVAVHVVLGLGAAWLGHALAYGIWR
jgi:CrcB protein